MSPARSAATRGLDGRRRVVIEGVSPEIDGGRFPAKRVVGQAVVVEADIFADGHDELTCVLLDRAPDESGWCESRMEPLGNDRWRGTFRVTQQGTHVFTIRAWVDDFATWRRGLIKKVEAGQEVSVEVQRGRELVLAASQRAKGAAKAKLRRAADKMTGPAAALDPEVAALAAAWPDMTHATTYEHELRVWVDRTRAGFSAWYELFPRSWSRAPGRHGTLRDVIDRLDYVAGMGFDVLYLPPIHPIGTTKRKGPNNVPVARPGDVGSPWAIGGPEGGHDAVHPDLGTLEDVRDLVEAARVKGIEVALDIAFQCSPDHPWVSKHPEWFKSRPDGTIQYAENPPKRYEDIYPLDFDSEDWQGLWDELKRVVDHWIAHGITIFRVDNPHTKSFAFWEWLIDQTRSEHPDVIFLSEAFTRPRVMYRLAKLGFTQSYTYFTWRNTKWELQKYFTELTQSQVREYFRPNLWPNTPDILHEFLQTGGPPAFRSRLVLAATLGSNYGIYGPAFELCESTPREEGSEEYVDSEKYQIREWDLGRPDSLADLAALVNRIRRDHPALQDNSSLRFHDVNNDHLIAYSKASPGFEDVILCVVNLDPHHRQAGEVRIPPEDVGVEPGSSFQVHDLITDARYLWEGPQNYVELTPGSPAHVFAVRRRVRTEQDFDYFR